MTILSLKNKMKIFVEVISEKEKKKNKKLLEKIDFLEKYLKAFESCNSDQSSHSNLEFQEYFDFKLNGLGV